MRLVTRADFDGLACGTILCRRGIVRDEFLFVHPKNIQDKEVEITDNDVLTNVPFHENAGLWFDHHSSEVERVSPEGKFIGRCVPEALSCARLVYDFYDGPTKMPELAAMIDEVDRVDSAHLTLQDALNPEGWVLLGFICDPRTGLGRWHGFDISNRDLMKLLMQELCTYGDLNTVFSNKHVMERVRMYNEQQPLYDEMIRSVSTCKNGVLVIDMRELSSIYVGNRFKPYALYPEAKVSVTLARGKGDKGSVAALGSSIFNPIDYDLGSLCLRYNGGGHKHVGTCQFSKLNAPEIQDIIKELEGVASK